MTFQTKDSITVNGTLVINSSGRLVTALAVNSATANTITNTSGGTFLTISADSRPGSGTQSWSFATNTGIGGPSSWITFPDSTIQTTAYNSGTVQGLFSVTSNSASGSGGSLSYSNGVFTFTPALNITGNAATVTNGVYTTDTGTVTNTMLAGSIANSKLTNSSITINGTSISLGGSATVTAAAGTLTGTTLNSTVVSSSLTTVGTLTGLTSSGAVSITDSTVSTSTTTGSFKTAGGAGIGGKLFVGDNISTGGDISGANITASTNITASNLLTTATNATVYNTTATTLGIGGAATTLNLGASNGTINPGSLIAVKGSATVVSGSATANGITFGTHGSIHDDGNFHIHSTSSNLWINAMDGSDINIGTQVNSGVSSNSNITIGKNLTAGNGNITAYNGFVAGAGAISGVALQIPNEGGIRNTYNGANNIYYDVSTGGATHGAHVFRGSSGFATYANIGSNGIQSMVPYVAKTAYNASLGTVITVDALKFQMTSTGGNFPQVVAVSGTVNVAWTAVAALNGTTISQTGNIGLGVTTATNLYSAHGMDAFGDTITVTLADRTNGKMYRVTFMRTLGSDGTTVGYSIVAERII